MSYQTDNITEMRIKKNMSILDIANALGISKQRMYYIRKRPLTYEMAVKISKILECNVIDLMGADILKVLPKNEKEKQKVLDIVNGIEVK